MRLRVILTPPGYLASIVHRLKMCGQKWGKARFIEFLREAETSGLQCCNPTGRLPLFTSYSILKQSILKKHTHIYTHLHTHHGFPLLLIFPSLSPWDLLWPREYYSAFLDRSRTSNILWWFDLLFYPLL